jgi:hypothetical protein
MITKHTLRVLGTVIVTVAFGWTAVSATAGTAKSSLTITKTGLGKVTSDPTGLRCGVSANPCQAWFGTGKVVKLTARAADGWAFSGWSGDCASATTRTCKLSMAVNRTVGVTFVQLHKLTVDPKGPGKVTSSPDGIRCGDDCTEKFRDGTEVTLDAQPNDGAILQAWGGACAGQATPTACVLEMTSSMSVDATFVNATATATGTMVQN